MTKKKKTLRAAVLASIFAMSICGWSNTVWADATNITTTNHYSSSNYVTNHYYNSTLVSESGTGDGVSNPSRQAFGPDYNYFLQHNQYINNEIDEVEAIIGIKMVTTDGLTGTCSDSPYTIDLNNDGQNDITIHGFQIHHVRYSNNGAESGGAGGNPYSPDGVNINSISLATNQEGTIDSHYCGESAKSISVGQIQKAFELMNSNEKQLASAIGTNDRRIDILEGGWTAKVNGEYVNQVTVGDQQNFISGKNITVSNPEDTYDIQVSLNDNIEGLTSITSQTVTATTSVTTPTLILQDGNNTTNLKWNNTTNRIEYGSEESKQQIATLNDGMKYGADSGNELNLKLNEKLNIKGGSNINTVASTVDGVAQITVNLNDDITVKSVTANLVDAYQVNATKINAGNIDVTHTLTADVVDATKVYADTLAVTYGITADAVTARQMFADTLKVTHDVTADALVAKTKTITPDLYLGEGQNKVTYTNDRITYQDNNNQTQQVANLNDGKTYYGDSGDAFVRIQDGVKIIGGAIVDNLSDGNIGVIAQSNNDGSATLNVKLSKDVTGLNSVTATTINSETVNVSKEININNKVKITENGMNINNKVVVEENNINVGGNTINNVAAGEISQNSTQAINGSQLYATNQRIEKLSGRVDKVGAGAAALAALHPMDFDPDDKLSFSAGVGNYGGETATALGMFYRPTEKVMLSAAVTMGNGENMVNMGVTFALDKTNNVSNSRVAMAREIQDLREQVAALTALVTQLAGRSNPALQDVVMFPYVPENHWAYDYIEGLQKRGIVEGYPDGNFAGDRSMTRYEYAAMLYRALEKGFPVDSRLLDEFDAELGRIRVDRIKGLDDDANKVERVRVNQYEDRDDYGSKLIAVNAVKQ